MLGLVAKYPIEHDLLIFSRISYRGILLPQIVNVFVTIGWSLSGSYVILEYVLGLIKRPRLMFPFSDLVETVRCDRLYSSLAALVARVGTLLEVSLPQENYLGITWAKLRTRRVLEKFFLLPALHHVQRKITLTHHSFILTGVNFGMGRSWGWGSSLVTFLETYVLA